MRFPATICLAIAVLLGSAGLSWGADFQKGMDAYRSGDFAAALREWKPLAEAGDAQAQTMMGSLFMIGSGVPQSYIEARRWFELAADQGFAAAQTNLSGIYLNGWGVDKNIDEGIKLQTQAAEQGFAKAQFLLGGNYISGIFTPVDYPRGLKWLKLAAAQKIPGAIQGPAYLIGQVYRFGMGVKIDLNTAYMWSTIAKAQGNMISRDAWKFFEKGMTAADISAAKKRAGKCIANNYKGC